MVIQAPKGTKDILPSEIYKWHYVEKIIHEVCRLFGFKEIRIPVFEHTELFLRSVGDTSDIVQKEMYTFEDKGGRSITLRPEGTAGVVRAYVEHGMASLPHPIKLYYFITAYRYENVQKGRYREHHQFGVEVFGAKGPEAEAELISMVSIILDKLGVKEVSLNINSVGCPDCRKDYQMELKKFLQERIDGLCDTCRTRFEKNPLRILDCKEKACMNLIKNAPMIIEYLCQDCSNHFEELKGILTGLNIQYNVNPRIVRGLDYYTKTVFEFVSNKIGAQGTVCGGGRYDKLVEEIGGLPTPGLGFGMGLERLLLVMEASGTKIPLDRKTEIFVATVGDRARDYARKMVLELRKRRVPAEVDLLNRSLKAQLKYADKLGVRFVLVVGDEEIESGMAKLKIMETGEEKEIRLEEVFLWLNPYEG